MEACSRARLALVAASLVLAACGGDEPARSLVDDVALADTVQGDDWLAFGRTSSEQRFSPLTQIDDSNVGGLAVDWYLDLPGDRGLGSTPLARPRTVREPALPHRRLGHTCRVPQAGGDVPQEW